jgi:hypothetical protein
MRVKCSCRSLHDCRTPYHLGSGSLVVDEVLGSLVAAFNLRWFLRRTMERGGDFGLLSNSSQPYPNSYGLCRVNNGTLSIRSHVLTFTAPMIHCFALLAIRSSQFKSVNGNIPWPRLTTVKLKYPCRHNPGCQLQKRGKPGYPAELANTRTPDKTCTSYRAALATSAVHING